ncbi:MAG: DUF2142 domain-containing protein [Streptococcaceae bacterium]|jgi:flagellar biosynthesis protein FliQ|nr:DUF2142 domain-containing protein [Streptococcaceae bacterium]
MQERRTNYRRRAANSNQTLSDAHSDSFAALKNLSRNQNFQKFSGIKPESIFLCVAVVIGLVFAIFQPLFIEPDSSYHFEKSTYIANTVVDRAKIGFFGEDYDNHTQVEPPYVSDWKKGVSWMSSTVADGSYFKLFFQTKLPTVNKDQVQDKRVEGSTWLNDISHDVPALGVMIGHAIYPSLGSMVITARILNLTFFILCLFFIIKRLAAYKLLFVFVSLSPTVIQLATSLSYDCYAYVAVALASACLINAAHHLKSDKKISFAQLGISFISLMLSSLALLFAKWNFWLLYLLMALVALGLLLKLFGLKIRSRQLAYLGLPILGIGALGAVIVLNEKLLVFIPKLFMSLLEPYYTILSAQILSGTSVAGLPGWAMLAEFAVLILVLLSQREEVVPSWFAWLGMLLFVVNMFGVLYTYALDKDFTGNIILGPQGRYFTPLILILAPFFTLVAQKIAVVSGKWLKYLVMASSILFLVLNFSVLATRFYALHRPLDEYRSGVEHYILYENKKDKGK